MKRLLALMCVLVASVAQAATPKLLVLTTRTDRSTDRELGLTVGELVVDAAGRMGGAVIVGERDATAFLDAATQKQLASCADDGACMVEIGGALGVAYMLAPSLGTIADQFVLGLRLYDAREGTVVARLSHQVAHDERALVAALCPKVHELIAHAAAQGAPLEAHPERCQVAAVPARDAPAPLPLPPAEEVLPEPPVPPVPQVVRVEPKPEPPKVVVQHGADVVSLLAQTLADESIEPAKKRERLKFETGLSEGELVRAIAQARPATLRRELCMPHVGKGEGQQVVVRAKDDDGTAVQGVVTIDGVRVGTTGAVLRVPVCVSSVLVEDPRTGAYWAGELKLGPDTTAEVMARFPGLRYEYERDVARDRTLRVTWLRTPPTDRLLRETAVSYCQNNKAGGGGWSLPTMAELEATRVPGTIAAPDEVAFPRAPEGWYFASDGAVLFDAKTTVATESPRHGGADATSGSVRCVRRHPRFAVRAGIGGATGILGVGVEWRPLRLVGVTVGLSGRPTLGLTLGRGDGESGWFVDGHLVSFARTDGTRGFGGGVTGGWDFRFLHLVSVKVGGGLSAHGTDWPVVLEANAGISW